MVPWVVCEGRTFCWRKSSFSGYFSMFSLQMFLSKTFFVIHCLSFKAEESRFVTNLIPSFSADRITRLEIFPSLLYYYGMLTIVGTQRADVVGFLNFVFQCIPIIQ